MASQPKSPRPRLGRGLSSLIGDSSAALADDQTYRHVTGLPPIPTRPPGEPAQADGAPRQIGLDEIAPNPYQPRRQFKDEDLAELAQSITSQGVLQPLIVARTDQGDRPFVLIAGERRLRAARQAGLATVPCIVRDASPQQMLEWALVENIQRAELNPIERAQAYREYIDRFSLTQAEAAARLGQPRPTVANYLRLMELPEHVQAMVGDGTISFGHAKLLAGLTGSAARQIRLAKKIAKTGMSVRQLEVALAVAMGAQGGSAQVPGAERSKPAYLLDLEERLGRAMGTRVAIQPGRAKNAGRVIIEYYSLEDFDRISAALGLEADGE